MKVEFEGHDSGYVMYSNGHLGTYMKDSDGRIEYSDCLVEYPDGSRGYRDYCIEYPDGRIEFSVKLGYGRDYTLKGWTLNPSKNMRTVSTTTSQIPKPVYPNKPESKKSTNEKSTTLSTTEKTKPKARWSASKKSSWVDNSLTRIITKLGLPIHYKSGNLVFSDGHVEHHTNFSRYPDGRVKLSDGRVEYLPMSQRYPSKNSRTVSTTFPNK